MKTSSTWLEAIPQGGPPFRGQAKGKYKGRQPKARAKTPEIVALAATGLSMAAIAAKLGIGKGSVHRALAPKPPSASH